MEIQGRLKALDVLRGITIAAMILVNTPGSWSYVYWPLLHAKWHGFTPTDAVFPFFLFIVGVSIHFSFKKNKEKENQKVLIKIVKRTVVIFSLGFFLNLFPKFNFETVRYFGVLQRIAIAYGIGAVLCLFFDKRKLIYSTLFILIAYWGILYFTVSDNPFAPKTNIVGKIDLYLFGANHVWKGLGFPFDPEGLLSTIPSIATVLIGFLTGGFLSKPIENGIKIKTLLSYGVGLVALGFIWGFVFPINKSLWTSTFVCYAAGWAMLMLAFLIWIIDVKKYTKWSQPFIHFGTNPLFIFVFSGLYVKTMIYLVKITNSEGEITSGLKYIYQNIFVPIAGNMNGSLLFAIAHILFFWSLVYVLFRNKIFIKI